MLNVGRIEEGFVLDHIKAGKAMTIYHDLGLDKLDCTVAIIKNAKSEKMGKKDILKVECSVDKMDLDILGFIDHNITVNVIKDGEITEKKELHLPKQVVDVIKCKNPRCITSIEQGLKHVFILADPEKEVYRCKYCDEKYTGNRNNKSCTAKRPEPRSVSGAFFYLSYAVFASFEPRHTISQPMKAARDAQISIAPTPAASISQPPNRELITFPAVMVIAIYACPLIESCGSMMPST